MNDATAATSFFRFGGLSPGVFVRATLASMLMLACGCCGLGERPKIDGVRYWVASIKQGSSGSDAFALLERKEFSPAYHGLTRIIGTQEDRCLVPEWISVGIDLDEAGRVVSTDVWYDDIFP